MIQVGPCDIRHTLLTLSRMAIFPIPSCQVEIFVFESGVEALTRQMLLLLMAVDFSVPTRTRMERLLEVHGNCLLQGRTASYVGKV